jgi:hypothetical protein
MLSPPPKTNSAPSLRGGRCPVIAFGAADGDGERTIVPAAALRKARRDARDLRAFRRFVRSVIRLQLPRPLGDDWEVRS